MRMLSVASYAHGILIARNLLCTQTKVWLVTMQAFLDFGLMDFS